MLYQQYLEEALKETLNIYGPDAYEMVDVFTMYHNLIASDRGVSEDLKSDLDDIFSHRKQNFIENGNCKV